MRSGLLGFSQIAVADQLKQHRGFQLAAAHPENVVDHQFGVAILTCTWALLGRLLFQLQTSPLNAWIDRWVCQSDLPLHSAHRTESQDRVTLWVINKLFISFGRDNLGCVPQVHIWSRSQFQWQGD
jgi:Trk-type K+ transport system membrane component